MINRKGMGGARGLMAHWSSIRQSCTAQAQLSADAKQATTAKEPYIAILLAATLLAPVVTRAAGQSQRAWA
eukprot:COSAG02_NODE_15336_length_1180_cov_2.207216_2_plen_71_part_00